MLIVEDNADLCHTLAEIFRKSGHKVVAVLNGAEAQRLLKTFLPQIKLATLYSASYA